MILSTFTVAKAILEVLTVLQELNVIRSALLLLIWFAAVKLAHKNEGSRHKNFFHKISFLSYLRYFWLCTMGLFFIQQYIVAKTCQLLTEIQNTVNSSPITLGKVATNVVHADSSHQILVNVRYRVPYLYHTFSTMQRLTLTFNITLTLTLHLLQNSQLVAMSWLIDKLTKR